MFLNNLTCNNKFSVIDFLNTLDTVAAIWTFQTLSTAERTWINTVIINPFLQNNNSSSSHFSINHDGKLEQLASSSQDRFLKDNISVWRKPWETLQRFRPLIWVFSEVKLGQYINSAEDLRKMGADWLISSSHFPTLPPTSRADALSRCSAVGGGSCRKESLDMKKQLGRMKSD